MEVTEREECLKEARGTSLERLQVVVLLGGSVRPTRLRSSIARSPLDLPVDSNQTLLECWCRELAELAEQLACPRLPVRGMIDQAAPSPTFRVPAKSVDLGIERDPFQYRGTGGVLRDLAAAYDDDDYMLVLNASQLLLNSLSSLVVGAAQSGGDVCVVSHADGTPSAMMLMRCGALRDISPSGFVDMKEQALPAIARRFQVEVLEHNEPTSATIRTVEDYIRALRRHHQRLRRGAIVAAIDPYEEDWLPEFSIAETGAQVGADARLHDSVVLAGGRLEAGAVAVRSLVCPGGVVQKGQVVIDRLVTGSETGSNG